MRYEDTKMPNRNVIILIVICGLLMLVIAGGFAIFNYDGGNYEKANKDKLTGITSQSVKESDSFNIQTTDLKPNTEPQFKIGDEFRYKTTYSDSKWNSNDTEIFYVERIDRINGTEYYVLFSSLESDYDSTGTYYLINKQTGSVDRAIFRLEYEDGHVDEEEENDEFIFTNLYIYADWMLALKEGLNFEIIVTETKKTKIKGCINDKSSHPDYMSNDWYIGNISITSKYEYEVEGIDKIKVGNNNRECFKVVEIIKEGNKISDDRTILWIDIEKRIMVKTEYRSENLKIAEVNLVSNL